MTIRKPNKIKILQYFDGCVSNWKCHSLDNFIKEKNEIHKSTRYNAYSFSYCRFNGKYS